MTLLDADCDQVVFLQLHNLMRYEHTRSVLFARQGVVIHLPTKDVADRTEESISEQYRTDV
jgi:hypothetical protein